MVFARKNSETIKSKLREISYKKCAENSPVFIIHLSSICVAGSKCWRTKLQLYKV